MAGTYAPVLIPLARWRERDWVRLAREDVATSEEVLAISDATLTRRASRADLSRQRERWTIFPLNASNATLL